MTDRWDERHDVAIVALTIFGATAATVGLPSSVLAFPAWTAAVLTALSAVIATSVIAAVDEDVTRVEAAVAAAIAIPLCMGVDWFAGRWAQREPVWTIGATAGGAIGAWFAARRSPSNRRGHRVLLAGFVTAGMFGLLVLLGLALYRAIGVRLNFVPWLACALAGGLLAWRAPVVSVGEVFAGAYFAAFGAALTLLPSLPREVKPVGLVIVVMAIVCCMFAAAATFMYAVVARRRKPGLPKARLR